MKVSTSIENNGRQARPPAGTPSYQNQPVDPINPKFGELPARLPDQVPLDLIDEACMESFPCSDPPCYTRAHA